ncbi:MAG: hypothetical protein IJ222_06895 [Bacteroidales bacterium]|nr:hypothetical protein [Bacteroidales bacterium]
MVKNDNLLHEGAYIAPACEVFGFIPGNSVLAGSEYGTAGHAGSDPEILDDLNF